MDLTHQFTIDRPINDVWPVLVDLNAVAQAIPGASIDDIESDGTHRGKLRVKLGSISAAFSGDARLLADDDAHTFTLEGAGKSPQGSATLRVEGTAVEVSGGKSTAVELSSSVELTGKIAQFGASMASDVAGQLLDAFVANLIRGFENAGSGQVDVDDGESAEDTPARSSGKPGGTAWQVQSEDTFDLGASMPALAKQAAPVIAGVAIFLLGLLIGRLGRRTGPQIVVVPTRNLDV